MSANDFEQLHKVALTRGLSVSDATLIGVGAMIGAGVFVLTGYAAGAAGPALVVAFALNGVITLLTAMSYAELGSAMPRAGGSYAWVREGLPQPLGFLAGWTSWFANAVACSLYALGFGTYFVHVLRWAGVPMGSLFEAHPGVLTKLLVALVVLAFVYVNYRGVSETGKTGSALTVGKVLLLLVFIAAGLWALGHVAGWRGHFSPFLPRGWPGVFIAMGLSTIAFEGYEIIAQCGEEVKHPRRDIPHAVLAAIGIVVPIYLLIAFVAIGAVRSTGIPVWQLLGNQGEMALVEAAKQFMPGGMAVLLFGGLLSTVSALNATIYSSSRISFAMARDASLPLFVARIHPRRRTPYLAILISGAVVLLMAEALPIEAVAGATGILFQLLFLQVSLSVITLRYRHPEVQRGFRVPWVPVLPAAVVAIRLALVVALAVFSPISLYVCIGWLALGLVIHYAYAGPQEKTVKGSKVVLEERDLEPVKYRVLVPLASRETVGPLLRLAAAVAVEKGGDILVVHVITVPPQLPLAQGRRFLNDAKPLMELAAEIGEQLDAPVFPMIRVSRDISQAIIEAAEERKADLILLGWHGRRGRRDRMLGTTVDRVVMDAPCDVAVLKPSKRLETLSSILVSTTASPHAHLGAEIGDLIAQHFGAGVKYLHVVKRGTAMDKDTMRQYLGRPPRESERPFLHIAEAASTTEGVIEEGKHHDLIIVGAARESPVQQLIFGTKPQAVARGSQAAVLMVKKFSGRGKSVLKRMFTRVLPAE